MSENLTILFTKTFYVVSAGADVSQTMVNYARQKHSEKRLSYIVLDIETSELPNDQIGQYENIFSFNCLHWCNDMWYFFDIFVGNDQRREAFVDIDN